MKEQDEQLLETIVKAIVNNPNDVVVERSIDERGVFLVLKINPADMGHVIGREGKTAQAIRTLLKIIGAKNNSRINLKIDDPKENERYNNAPAKEEAKEEVKEESKEEPSVDTSAIDDLNI